MRWGSNTLVRLDKRLFDILKDMGVNIDAGIFKEAYTLRIAERKNAILREQQGVEGRTDTLIHDISLDKLASKPKRRKKDKNALLIHI